MYCGTVNCLAVHSDTRYSNTRGQYQEQCVLCDVARSNNTTAKQSSMDLSSVNSVTEQDMPTYKLHHTTLMMGWTEEFDALLTDSLGLHTFAQYLKKEFSHENLYFWCMCEKYKQTTDIIKRRAIANEIMEKHLDISAWEPVNINSITYRQVQENINTKVLDTEVFVPAQTEIYNLMKFDSFRRFVKSDWLRETGAEDIVTARGAAKCYNTSSDLSFQLRKRCKGIFRKISWHNDHNVQRIE